VRSQEAPRTEGVKQGRDRTGQKIRSVSKKPESTSDRMKRLVEYMTSMMHNNTRELLENTGPSVFAWQGT
jgi:hypothetical protein